jgi:hypothetical protein
MSEMKEAPHAEATERRGELSNQYRKIGISALAATLPYAGEQKNTNHAPVKKVLTIRDLEWLAG